MPLFNRQRRVRIDGWDLDPFLRELAKAVGHKDKDFTITLVSDRAIRSLNRRFRGLNRPTDVLSFPTGSLKGPWRRVSQGEVPNLGEIVISVETAQQQADQEGHALKEEIKLLIIHGVLHLMGQDHESDGGRMNRNEYTLRTRLL